MRTVLEVRNLNKSFRKNPFSKRRESVLKDLSFEVPAGKITGFLGANGAGKTTTIKCLLGLAHPDSGEIRYFGSQPLTVKTRGRIGFLPERPYFYEYLTGYEFLKFYGQISTTLSKSDLDRRIDGLLNRVGLPHARNRQLRNYSKGMLQRIGIAQALIHKPEFIILDEPMTGLDPDGRWEVNRIIKETADAGTAVFFSSHLLNDAEKICENLVVLKKGRVIYQGTTSQFIGQVSPGTQISFRTRSESTETVILEDLSQVQKKIDEVRSQGGVIVEVRPVQVSLEEAFIKAAIGE